MATLVLQTAGAAIGGLFGPFGAILGRALGGLAGAVVDQAIFGSGGSAGGAVKDLDVTASTEGTPIPQVFGRGRVAGQIIWATRLEAVTYRRKSSAKGGAMGGANNKATAYMANIALGLCEGEIGYVGRVWADGKPLDREECTMRVYTGSETQEPDPLIVAKEGVANAPAYKGLAYVVFERLNLEPFGNRIPQLSFEVIRPIGELEKNLRAITIIPGAGEFIYDNAPVMRTLGLATSDSENRHTTVAATDWEASLDEVQALCPNLSHVSLIVTWFGSDLRAGHCTITPRVDSTIKRTVGRTWRVGNLTRQDALAVSQDSGRPAYGGTPADSTVIDAIRDLKKRGLAVTLYPFIMMDVPSGNTLTDPYTGASNQPAYPWRGQITCSPAANASDTVDGTEVAAAQVGNFFGTALPGHFSNTATSVSYTGPDEWTFRRFILHMAYLAKAAGGVDTFIIGSEMPALTRVRGAGGAYPATPLLQTLAADVRGVLGSTTKLTYAADWTEYGAHSINNGQDVGFPLDSLWADDNIDAVGIDWYAPMADWRDGNTHQDAQDGARMYDADYLHSNIIGGEAYDWYYASAENRDTQNRTPITDGLGKPWIFRQKDLKNWWQNAHYERVDGVEKGSPTPWVPGSKPIWLTETGCGAVDKGANSPNVFPDPKSSLNALPHFSNGRRDDLIQRRLLEAIQRCFDARMAGHKEEDNPVSTLYGAPMLDADRIYFWTWDARPFPAFPYALDVWADGKAHITGHWLTGRLGQAPIAELVQSLFNRADMMAIDTRHAEGIADGYVLDRIVAVRDALEPLIGLFNLGTREHDGIIRIETRGRSAALNLDADLLAVDDKSAEPQYIRAQETELPMHFAVGYNELAKDFQTAATTATRFNTKAQGTVTQDTALVMDRSEAQRRADIKLQDLWVARETVTCHLPPNLLHLEAGDLVRFDDRSALYEIMEINDAQTRRISCRAIAPAIFDSPRQAATLLPPTLPRIAGPPTIMTLDLPYAGSTDTVLTYGAVAASPWPGAVVLWKSMGGTYEPDIRIEAPAIMGETLDTMPDGVVWRWDNHSAVTVQLASGELQSVSDERVFAGANRAAIGAEGLPWEIIQFGMAELIAPRTYRLSRLLRGMYGTEAQARLSKPLGSRFVLLDEAIEPLVSGVELLGKPQSWKAVAAPKDAADPFATDVSVTPSDTALRPRAPVHLKARRVSGGVALSWIRRTRHEGDNWNAVEVPLGEEKERYRVRIRSGSTVVRTVEVDQPGVLYTAAQELADFGSVQTTLSIAVCQISTRVGEGEAGERMCSL